MKKNGFISTTLIYTFFILFLLLMVFLISNYSNNRYLTDQYKHDIKNSFTTIMSSDINLYVMVLNNATGEYEEKSDLPSLTDYIYHEDVSYCDNSEGKPEIVDGQLVVSVSGKTNCYAYFYSR